MTVAGIAWVVLTPYFTAVLVGSAPRVNRAVARHIVLTSAIGWTAVVALLAGVFVVGGITGTIVAAACAPLVGLAFWLPSRGRGGDEPPDEPDDEPSPGDSIDWDRFERELADWRRELERPRVPA